MRYRIEYADEKKCCAFANGKKELLQVLKSAKSDEIEDIRKVYKNGASDSVMDSYTVYIRQN